MSRHSSRKLPGAESSAPLFAALGDEIRLQLVLRLGDEGPLSIASLTSGFPITRQAVTRHLQVLSSAGLVHSTRNGRESLWELDRKCFDQARAYLELLSKRWDGALSRLRDYVEK